MKPQKRTRELTGVTSLRLTPAEEQKVLDAAGKRGLTKSQWLRQTVLNAVDGAPESRALLAEFMALRAVILPLHAELLKGGKITDGLIADILKQADARKYALAASRIEAIQNGSQKE